VCVKDASIAVHLKLLSGSLKWNISFISVAYDWNEDFFALFFKLLYSLRVRWEGEDNLCLMLDPSIVSLFTRITLHFLGILFGRIRLY